MFLLLFILNKGVRSTPLFGIGGCGGTGQNHLDPPLARVRSKLKSASQHHDLSGAGEGTDGA